MPGIWNGQTVRSASPPTLTGPLSLFGLRARQFTTSTVLTADDIGCVIFTTGATTAVTFTLPPPCGGPNVAPFFWFVSMTGNAMTVQTATADTLVTINDTAADSLAASVANATIGAMIFAVCDGTNWAANGFALGTAVNGGFVVAT